MSLSSLCSRWRQQLLARAFSVLFSSHTCTGTFSTAFTDSRSQTSYRRGLPSVVQALCWALSLQLYKRQGSYRLTTPGGRGIFTKKAFPIGKVLSWGSTKVSGASRGGGFRPLPVERGVSAVGPRVSVPASAWRLCIREVGGDPPSSSERTAKCVRSWPSARCFRRGRGFEPPAGLAH